MPAAVNPTRSEWDVIVIGGAAAGENAAQYATQFSGLDSVIVEKELMGGECSSATGTSTYRPYSIDGTRS